MTVASDRFGYHSYSIMRKELVLLLFFSGVALAAGAAPKIIIENDWNTNAYITFLLAIDAGWDVLGLVGNTANSWSTSDKPARLSIIGIRQPVMCSRT
jgi:hypothetical protein